MSLNSFSASSRSTFQIQFFCGSFRAGHNFNLTTTFHSNIPLFDIVVSYYTFIEFVRVRVWVTPAV